MPASSSARLRVFRFPTGALASRMLVSAAIAALAISPSPGRADTPASAAPVARANSETYDAQYDYLLTEQLHRVNAVEADSEGRKCYAGLEGVKSRLHVKSVAEVVARLKGPGLFDDDSIVRAWSSLADECLTPAANFPKEPWFAVDMGLWLGIASSADHPALHALSMRWLTIAAKDAYGQKNAVVTRNACYYLHLIARPSEFHCFPRVIAWAVAATTAPSKTSGSDDSSEERDIDEQQQMMDENQRVQDERYQEQMQQNNEAEFEREQQMQNP